jgi:hypothetical protein
VVELVETTMRNVMPLCTSTLFSPSIQVRISYAYGKIYPEVKARPPYYDSNVKFAEGATIQANPNKKAAVTFSSGRFLFETIQSNLYRGFSMYQVFF